MNIMRIFLATVLICFWGVQSASANFVTVTDIAGRKINVKSIVNRVLLGEGRQLYVLAALDFEDPTRRIVGWRNDLIQADPTTYQAYLERYPDFSKIPVFGGQEQSLFDIEAAIVLEPDVIFLNLDAKQSVEEARYIEKLSRLGIAVIYLDFRHDPDRNTAASIRLLGKVLGKQGRAEKLIAFRQQQIDRVTQILEKQSPNRPAVFIDRAGGFYDDCCHTFGNGNIGELVEKAGGRNIAKSLLPGTFGQINAEQVIAANPEHVIVTSANWEAYVPSGDWVPVGPGADADEVQRKLGKFLKRPAYTGISAQESNGFHALWHQFYNSPYSFIALQQMAKWFHPDLFKELDTEQTFRQLHEQFLPVDYQPGYFATYSGEE